MWICWRRWIMYTEVPSIILKWNLSSSLLSVDHEWCRQLRLIQYGGVVSYRELSRLWLLISYRSISFSIGIWSSINHRDVKSHLISSLQSQIKCCRQLRFNTAVACRVVSWTITFVASDLLSISISEYWNLKFDQSSWCEISSLLSVTNGVVSWIITFVCCIWSPFDLNQWVVGIWQDLLT
jgi:hypothetical protein